MGVEGAGAWVSAITLATEVGIMPGEDLLYWARDVGYPCRTFGISRTPIDVWVPGAEDGPDAARRLALEWRVAGFPRSRG